MTPPQYRRELPHRANIRGAKKSPSTYSSKQGKGKAIPSPRKEEWRGRQRSIEKVPLFNQGDRRETIFRSKGGSRQEFQVSRAFCRERRNCHLSNLLAADGCPLAARKFHEPRLKRLSPRLLVANQETRKGTNGEHPGNLQELTQNSPSSTNAPRHPYKDRRC